MRSSGTWLRLVASAYHLPVREMCAREAPLSGAARLAKVCAVDLLIRAAADMFSGVCRFETTGGHMWRSDTRELTEKIAAIFVWDRLPDYAARYIVIGLRNEKIS
jgi:hypothetical protein